MAAGRFNIFHKICNQNNAAFGAEISKDPPRHPLVVTQYNFLLLTIDTLRADRLGSYGFHPSITQNLDRLADNGVRFNSAITGGTWTQAAFPVLMTSTYASMYGGCLGVLSPERPSPVEILAENGYATAAFSSNPHLSKQFGYDRGFSTFVDLVPTAADPALRSVTGGQALLRLPLTHAISGIFGKKLAPAAVYVPAEAVTAHLCDWLSRTKISFFAWAHFMDVHWPYHQEARLKSPTEIANAWTDLAHYHAASWHDAPITPAHRDRYTGLYDSALKYLDGQIGRLLSRMEEMGHLENTVIIVVADHGEEFLDHGRWGHWENNLYDEILKVPFIISFPGGGRGETIQRQVRVIDLMPTLLDLAGFPPDPKMEGTTLTPLWMGGGEYPVEDVICEMWRDHWHRIAVRTKDHKFIWDSRKPDEPELFDLIKDSAEQHNVAESDAFTALSLKTRVEEHIQRVRATTPAELVVEPELDEMVLQRLRGLGYIE